MAQGRVSGSEPAPTVLAGKGALAVSIGQVPLTFHFEETSLLKRAARRYAAFLTSEYGSGLPIVVEPGPLPSASGHEFSLQFNDAVAAFDSGSARFCGVQNEFALDSLVRMLLTELLLPETGFLLHAATIVRDDKAYIFTGPSGAGKSTIAGFSRPATVLTDEISLLRFSAGDWQAHGTPFWGKFRGGGTNRRLSVAGIYSLAQATENRVDRLTQREALRALFTNVLYFGHSTLATDQLLSVLLAAAARIPCYRLHFRRDPSFWKSVAC